MLHFGVEVIQQAHSAHFHFILCRPYSFNSFIYLLFSERDIHFPVLLNPVFDGYSFRLLIDILSTFIDLRFLQRLYPSKYFLADT